jgi:hypothetical protein
VAAQKKIPLSEIPGKKETVRVIRFQDKNEKPG